MFPSFHLLPWSELWEVLRVFLIPFGLGIPSGVMVAQAKSMDWHSIALLYFFSDLILACLFEPILRVAAHKLRTTPRLQIFRRAYKQALFQTIEMFSLSTGPIALVAITFGSDPMTGRTITYLFGHGIFTGWLIAITGDMLFFGVLMASTIWVNSVLGSPKQAAIIVTLLVIGLPALVKHWRKRRSTKLL